MTGKLECPDGIYGLGTAPQQSLAALLLVLVLLVLDVRQGRVWISAVVALVLGAAFAWGCIASAPPLPKTPEKPYDAPPKVCRPPFPS